MQIFPETRAAQRAGLFGALLCAFGLTGLPFILNARAGERTGDTAGTYEQADAAAIIQSLLSSKTWSRGAPGLKALTEQVRAFYEARSFQPAWTGDEAAVGRGARVREALERACEQGLVSSDYTSALDAWPQAPAAGSDTAVYDVALTAALVRYASDLRLGRVDPTRVYPDFELPQQTFDVAGALTAALAQNSIDAFLSDLPPPYPAYRALVAALARYRSAAQSGGWPSVPNGHAERSVDPMSSDLVARLAIEDPILNALPNPTRVDVHDAVARFQRRMGFASAGAIDPDTLKQLNVPAQDRAEQIAANMERWRWLPRSFENRYVLVNITDQSLDFVLGGKSILHSRVVIGRTSTPTPIFRTTVKAVITNPPWDIPDDIAARMHWSPSSAGFDSANGQLRLKPGPRNPLGTILLDSPNYFGVYMHDTPNKDLFRLGVRTKSNGCVRVEDIVHLASLVLNGGNDGGSEQLEQAIKSGKTVNFPLSDPLPVYMLYWTAAANDDGTVQFSPDFYRWDPRLIAKLEESRSHARASAQRCRPT